MHLQHRPQHRQDLIIYIGTASRETTQTVSQEVSRIRAIYEDSSDKVSLATFTDVTSTDVTSTDVTSTDVTSTDVTSTDVTSTDVTSTDGDLDCYWDYLEQLAVSRVAQTQTIDTDFADVVIQPDPNECDTALLISDSYDDESIPDEDNDPDFPEPGQRTAQTNLTTHGPQRRKDYRKRIAEFSWVIVSVEFLLNKSLFVSR